MRAGLEALKGKSFPSQIADSADEVAADDQVSLLKF